MTSQQYSDSYLQGFTLGTVIDSRPVTPESLGSLSVPPAGPLGRLCAQWCLLYPSCSAFNLRLEPEGVAETRPRCELLALGYWKVSGLVAEPGSSFWAV